MELLFSNNNLIVRLVRIRNTSANFLGAQHLRRNLVDHALFERRPEFPAFRVDHSDVLPEAESILNKVL